MGSLFYKIFYYLLLFVITYLLFVFPSEVIEYLILKRKLYENIQYPQKRLQVFSPASGKPSINKVMSRLDEFMAECYDENGKIIAHDLCGFSLVLVLNYEQGNYFLYIDGDNIIYYGLRSSII